jgi:hypothetical protein
MMNWQDIDPDDPYCGQLPPEPIRDHVAGLG